jgi:ferric-dicitrate binding protein FerR (iron transport regulator)
MRVELLKKLIAIALLFSTVLITTPVSAAELAEMKASVGSVAGVGTVRLRGVTIPQEGTIFSGNELQVGNGGFAKVTMVAGHRIQLEAGTRVTIVEARKSVLVQVGSGNVGFNAAAGSPLRLAVGPYEVVPASGASGNVAYVGSAAIGLRASRGAVSVNRAAQPLLVIPQGQERVLFAGQSSQPLTQLASDLPGPIPEASPLPPQVSTPAGKGLTRSGWLTILATVGGAAAAIAVLATR